MPGFVSCFLPDEDATRVMGQKLARSIADCAVAEAGFVIYLLGDLGAGNTTLVRGVLSGLGYAGRVKSPTYPLLETYQVGNVAVAHFDLYRLESPDAFTEAGFEDYFVGPGLRFVEWPDRAAGRLPTADWHLALTEAPEGGRQITIESVTAAGARLLAGLAR